MVGSYEELVVDNETFSYFRKVANGVAVNEDTLALEVVESVARGGNYLDQDHTLRHLRSGELFIPKVGFGDSWTEWEAKGSRDIRTVARDFAQKVVNQEAESILPSKLNREIEGIMKAAHRELVEKAR